MPDVHASSDSVHGDDIGFRGGYGIPAVYAGTYWQSLKDYEAFLPEYVEGAFVYQVGGFEDWATHEVLGSEIEGWWAAEVKQEPAEPPLIGGDDDMAEFQQGFATLAAVLGYDVVGEPEADEKTLHDPDGSVVLAIQPTTLGMMLWVPGGQPKFLAAAPKA